MIFHTFGNKENKAVMLIHGMLCPWQIWNTAIEKFRENYYVIVPELDAHTEEVPTAFESIEDEAEKICEYITDELNGQVYLLAGLSMGGRIAATIAKTEEIRIEHLVLDGAPLMKINGLFKSIMKNNYKTILSKSRARDPIIKEAFERDFLPGEYWETFLKIADSMDKKSVDNIIDTVFAPFEFIKYPADMRILFMHGTKSNEAVSKKGALKMKALNPEMEIRCFEGCAHAELAVSKAEQWVKEVEGFIS